MDRYDIICGRKQKKHVPVIDPPCSDKEEAIPFETKGSSLYFESIKDLLQYMKNDGGFWLSSDDVRGRFVGFEKSDGSRGLYIGLSRLKNSMHTLPDYVSELIQKINGRKAIGYLLSGRFE